MTIAEVRIHFCYNLPDRLKRFLMESALFCSIKGRSRLRFENTVKLRRGNLLFSYKNLWGVTIGLSKCGKTLVL